MAAGQSRATITVTSVNDSVAGPVGNIPSATVDPSTDTSPAYSNNVKQDQASNFGTVTRNQTGKRKLPNELRDFASYNYIFTLGCLNNYELNFPDLTYRKNDPSVLILRSGGGAGDASSTIYEFRSGKKLEYYIDNVDINSIISANPKTKQTNAVEIDFNVIEPYSMGLFLQTLQTAAFRAGHKNYLEAPYLLTVDFKGYNVNGKYVNKPNLKRIFPIKFINIDFEVTEGGSVYNIKCIPWNEQALTNQVQSTKSDIKLFGSTIEELCQSGALSIASLFNAREQKKKKDKETVTPDEFVILFPKERASSKYQITAENSPDDGATINPGDTQTPERVLTNQQKQKIFESIPGSQNTTMPADFDAELSKLLGIVVKRSSIGESIREFSENPDNINEIGKSKIVTAWTDGGKQPFGTPGFLEVDGRPGVFKRGGLQISENGRELVFKSGTTIQDMIEEMIMLSEYGRKILSGENIDENGFVNWFKIETNVYNITDYAQVDLTGRSPKIYVYKVVPYKAHISRYAPVSKVSPGMDYIESQAVKEYDYIYTGKNDDILEFKLTFDKAFFTALSNSSGSTKLGVADKKTESIAAANQEPKLKNQSGDEENLSSSGLAETQENVKNYSGNDGGGYNSSIATNIARDFNDAIINSTVDLISANMTILGDPYFIADSGMGNYSADVSQYVNVTSDGTMDYQSSEVDIIVNFRTPLDIGKSGYYDFPGTGTAPVGAFSGLYQVIFCRNSFKEGVFTQDLRLIRRKNQTNRDTTSIPTTTLNVAKTEIEEDTTKVNEGTGVVNTPPGL